MTRADERLADEIERIYGDRYLSLCRLAATVAGSPDSAHDVVQEAFARALAYRRSYSGSGSLEGWLWRIVIRTAHDVRSTQPLLLPADRHDRTDDEVVVWSPELPYPARDPDLDAALRALPTRQRLVIFLWYFVDLSHAEITALTGMKLGTVSATLAQAKATLAERLSQPSHLASGRIRDVAKEVHK